MAASPTRINAMDHVVVVLFENRSLDNMLGRLYGPEDGKTFEGVIGKDLSNPIPQWAEHGADRKVVPYGSRPIWTHRTRIPVRSTSTPTLSCSTPWTSTTGSRSARGFQIGEGVTAPRNAPPAGGTPTMDGFVTDYISTFTGEMGRQPTYDEYAIQGLRPAPATL